MKRIFGGLLVLLCCTAMAQAAKSPACPQRPGKGRPIQDLSGSLPVPDYLDSVLACGLEEGDSVEGPPPSEWMEGEATRYVALLARGKYPLLVLPAQTQYYGFDRTERALIGAEVADALADQGSAPDTYLVGRALGETRRRYPAAKVWTLTEKLGAKRLVEVYAGHDGAQRMTLTILVKECGAGDCRLVKQRDWRGLPFSGEQPPFRVVNGLRTAIRKDLFGLAPLPAVAVKGGLAANPLLNVTPAKLKTMPGNPEIDLLLATLAPRAGQYGHERLASLALRSALRGGDAPAYRVLAASAAFELGRRTYALKLLEGVQTPEAATLREMLNGNLPDAQEKLKAVQRPLARLELALGIQSLAVSYHREVSFDAQLIARAFGTAAAQWQGLVERRVDDDDAWKETNAEDIKLALDEAFPIESYSLKSTLVGGAVVRGSRDTGNVALANVRHLRAALAQLDPVACCARDGRSTTAWQWYWLLDSANDSNVLQDLRMALEVQGNPPAARALIDRFDPFYSGHPYFERWRALVASNLGANAPRDLSLRYQREYNDAEYSANIWSQGQGDAAQGVSRRSDYLAWADAYAHEWPRRPDWPMPGWEEVTALQRKRMGCEALENSIHDIGPVVYCLEQTPAGEQPQLRAALRARFHGHPAAKDVLRAPETQQPNSQDPLVQLRAEYEKDPDNWQACDAVGRYLVETLGRYDEGQKLYLEFASRMKNNASKRVMLSNISNDAGSELFWRGEPELARPLFKISADLQTGSGGSLSSAARLALLDGDYETSAMFSEQRGDRYQNVYGYRDYLVLLHVLGESEAAHSGFLQIAERWDNPQVWVSELVGQRMRGMTYEQMKAWVLTEDIRGARYRGRRFAPYFALLWATTDRTPPADFPQLMAQIERDAKRTVESPGFLTRPHTLSEDGLELVNASPFRAGKMPRLPAGTSVKSEYVLLADAMTAMGARNYPAAVDKFNALADFYPIEVDTTGFALSYFAFAAAKTGDRIGLEKYIEALQFDDGQYDVWLARAYFAAVRKESDKAEAALKRAFNLRPQSDMLPLLTEYQYAQACETIGIETGDPRFTRMLLDWARKHQKIQPAYAWAYAVEAQYSSVALEADRALAMALYLDPASPRLRKFDVQRIAKARRWIEANNPFKVKKTPAKQRVTQRLQSAISPAT